MKVGMFFNKKVIIVLLALLCAVSLLAGCGAKEAVPVAAPKEIVQTSMMSGWEQAIRTLAVSSVGKNTFGEDLLKDVSIESYAVLKVAIPLPDESGCMDLQVTDARGDTFLLTGLDLSQVKSGEEANVELMLNSDGTGVATYIYFPDDVT